MGVASWRFAGDLLGGGRSRLDDHGRDHVLQGLAAVNEDMAMTVMPLRACWHSFLTQFAGPSATPSITGQRAKDISRRHPYRAQLEANTLACSRANQDQECDKYLHRNSRNPGRWPSKRNGR